MQLTIRSATQKDLEEVLILYYEFFKELINKPKEA